MKGHGFIGVPNRLGEHAVDRNESRSILSTLIRLLGDFDLVVVLTLQGCARQYGFCRSTVSDKNINPLSAQGA